MTRSMNAAAWCAGAALALAGCGDSEGGTEESVAGSFEIRAVSAEASLSGLPADAECAQAPLALNESGWVCDDATSTGYLVESASLTAGDVAAANAEEAGLPGSANWGVRLTFTDTGATTFHDLTSAVSVAAPPSNKIVVLVDGAVVSAPSVLTPITGGEAMIALDDGEAEAQAVAAAIVGTSG